MPKLEEKTLPELQAIAESLNLWVNASGRDGYLRVIAGAFRSMYTIEPTEKENNSSVYVVRKHGQELGIVKHNHLSGKWCHEGEEFDYPVTAIAKIENSLRRQ